jgi:1-acyl-sn-glycerol-3-phosphate acyltransferase
MTERADGGGRVVGPPPLDALTPFERRTFQAMEAIYRRALPISEWWLRSVSSVWMTIGSFRMVNPVGIERVQHLKYTDSILLVSNHRSFFDMYMLLLQLHRHTEVRQPPMCPVRSDFFYNQPAGPLVNLLVGAGRMFPPFFREPSKQEFNKWALELVIEHLRRGTGLVGFHPEGTRNKNPSPYDPLPAQPGVGKLVMETWPIIVPAFINGLTNDFIGDFTGNFTGSRKVVAVFGEPMDLTPFRSMKNRLASHKRIADALLARIYELGEEERAYRQSKGWI